MMLHIPPWLLPTDQPKVDLLSSPPRMIAIVKATSILTMRVAAIYSLSSLAVLAGALGLTLPSFAQQKLNTPKVITLSWIDLNTDFSNPIRTVAISQPNYFAKFAPVDWSDAENSFYSNKIGSPKLFPVWHINSH